CRCTCGGALQRQTMRRRSGCCRVALRDEREESQGAKRISISEPDTYSASRHSGRNSEGETGRVCMCERSVCA
ncbi:hypothetical protein M9458_033652, partial [Cirrhinus mrigala]